MLYRVNGRAREARRVRRLAMVAVTVEADSPGQAARLALAGAFDVGGTWVEEPEVSEVPTDQVMRAIGAPMLPGLG